MVFKATIICISALLIQNILGQSIDNLTIDNCDCNSNSSDSESDNSINSIDSYSSNAGSSDIGNFIENICSYSNIGIDKASNNPSIITNSCLKSSGGPFFITCTGPVVPSGIKVDASNNLVGELLITGQLPFLSAVRFESSFPTDGQASVAYGCGDGSIGIEKIISCNAASPKSGVCSCSKY